MLELGGSLGLEQLDRPLFVTRPGATPLAETELPRSPTVAVGPEGGFAPDELPEDATPLGLGPRVLRTETAAIAVASIVGCRSPVFARPRAYNQSLPMGPLNASPSSTPEEAPL